MSHFLSGPKPPERDQTLRILKTLRHVGPDKTCRRRGFMSVQNKNHSCISSPMLTMAPPGGRSMLRSAALQVSMEPSRASIAARAESWSLERTTTLQPLSASSRATAPPMPLEPPHTTASRDIVERNTPLEEKTVNNNNNNTASV
ncbi:hypothetical protein F7725_027122 [Dissostichus mawsoni]|uniref:Uncharacterized protein n=1 Tax=Dissostichus mawsoni TaxID=36200 RepID=A0A7J5XC33_DISMA|nr:hypothetical protein F7725_027122 [Dissostichus mawsoni]